MLFLHLLQGLFFNCKWPGLPEDAVVALIKVHLQKEVECSLEVLVWVLASWLLDQSWLVSSSICC